MGRSVCHAGHRDGYIYVARHLDKFPIVAIGMTHIVIYESVCCDALYDLLTD